MRMHKRLTRTPQAKHKQNEFIDELTITITITIAIVNNRLSGQLSIDQLSNIDNVGVTQHNIVMTRYCQAKNNILQMAMDVVSTEWQSII